MRSKNKVTCKRNFTVHLFSICRLLFKIMISYKNSPVSSIGSQMDWKYTNEPDGKTCLAMNEGRCSWHRGKAIGHNGSKAFLKSQLSNAHISLF